MLVSVVIPTFNRASMLPDAIDSVLRQTYKNTEIIVVDDGSTDDTPAVLARYGDAIRVIRQQNQGAGVARNRALDVARGDLIAFLDSDDEWLDFKLALEVEIMRARPEFGFLYTEFVVRREDGTELHEGTRRWLNVGDWSTVFPAVTSSSALDITVPVQSFNVYSGRMYRTLLRHYHILPTTAVVRRSLLRPTIRFAEGPQVFEDWEFFARLSRDTDGAFADIETAVNRGHQTPGRLTLCSLLTKLQAHVAMMERVWEADPVFMSRYRDELVAVKSEVLSKIVRNALLDGHPEVARNAIRRRRLLHVRTGPRALMYSMLAYLPGGAPALRMARKTLHAARNAAAILTTIASWLADW